MRRDIIMVFPPEIWVYCIVQACYGERYMTDLSKLTTVSLLWRKCLTNARSLWANIHVNDGDEGSIEIIPTFLVLSGSHKLSLTIWVPLSKRWGSIIPVLSTHRDRIHEICLRSDSPSHRAGCGFNPISGGNELCDSLKRVLDDLGHPKAIEYLDAIAERPVALRLDWVPPNLVSAINWLFPSHLLVSLGHRFKFYDLSIRKNDIAKLLRHPSAFGQVRHLDIYSDEEKFASPIPINIETTLQLLSLNTLRYHGLFPMDLMGLINSSARSLRTLDLHVGIMHLDFSMRTLSRCENLQHLSLTLCLDERASRDIDQPKYTFNNIKSVIFDLEKANWRLDRLKHLKCKVNSTGSDLMIQDLNLDALWLSFCTLFPDLYFLAWDIPVRSFAVPVKSVVIADLLHFSVMLQRTFTMPEGFVLTQLRSLTLSIGEKVEVLWNIRAEDLPLLRLLSITFLGPRTRFDLPNFPSLVEITTTTQSPAFTQGMQLCLSLLQEPQKCLCLEQINLDSLLEWDILYLMLRRRNLHATKASRIKRIRVPSVPAKFRHIFVPLLAGTEALPTSHFLRLSYLSIQEAQSRLLDVERKGCFNCVQLGFTDCDEPLHQSKLYKETYPSQRAGRSIREIIEPLSSFPLYEWCSTNPALATGLTDEEFWMAGHQKRIEKWRVAAFRWSRSHQRTLMCHGQRCNPTLILTEHDLEGTDNPPNAKSVLSLGIPVPSTIPQLSPSQRIYGKSDRPDEITACALSLVRQIRNPHHPFRSSAAHTFATFAIHDKFRKDFSTLVESLIPQPKNNDCYTWETTGYTYSVLTSYRLHDAVLAAIESLIKQLGHQNNNMRSAAAAKLSVLSAHSGLRATVQTATQLLTRHFMSEDRSTKCVVASGLVALSLHAELHYIARREIEALVEQLQDTGNNDRLNAVSGLKLLAEYEDLRNTIRNSIPRLFEFSYDQGPGIRSNSISIFCTLAKNDDLRGLIGTGISPLIKLFDDVDPSVQSRAVNSISELSQFGDLRRLIYTSIPAVIRLFNDTKAFIRSGAVKVITELSEFGDLRGPIRNGIPELITLLNVPEDTVRSSATNAIFKLIKFEDFRSPIYANIPRIIKLLNHSNPTVRSRAVNSLSKLSSCEELLSIIKNSIPQLFDFSYRQDPHVRCSSVSVFCGLAEHDDLRGLIHAGIPQVIKLLNDSSSTVRSSAVNSLYKLSSYEDLHNIIRDSIPQLFEFSEGQSIYVRLGSLSVFCTLAEHDDLRGLVRAGIPRVIQLLKDPNSGVRACAAKSLSKLSRYDDLHGIIRDSGGSPS